jgi:hypothetical protein
MGFVGGVGSDAWARYPQTGDFITNVSARRGEVKKNGSRLRDRRFNLEG